MQNNGSFSINLGVQEHNSFSQLKKRQQNLINSIKNISLSENKIDKDLFEKINKKKGQLQSRMNSSKGSLFIDLQRILNEHNNWTSFIQQQKQTSQLLAKSWKLYQQQNNIYLLKNGSYYVHDKQIFLIFSQTHIICLTTAVDQKLHGFRYKYRNNQLQNKAEHSPVEESQLPTQQNSFHADNKQVYCGQFEIKQKQIVCSGKGKLLIRQNKFWSIYSGIWKKNQIKEKEQGEKHCYWDQKMQQVKQHWKGGFKNMKYHGIGILSKYKDGQRIKTQQLQYEFGILIKSAKSS